MALTIEEHVPLSRHTTLKTGGVARYFTVVHTREELAEAVAFATATKAPYFVLGGGSNVLAAAAGYSGLVIKMLIGGREYSECDGGVVPLRVGAGEELDAVIAETVERGYWGLENLSAIPGTVGATPVQNVGAYGVEVKDVIEEVEVYHARTDTVRTLSLVECAFGYRDSFFKTPIGQEYIITAVVFRLSITPQPKLQYRDLAMHFNAMTGEPTPALVRDAVIAIRAAKFPDWRVVGTAGSFFKNPVVPRKEAEAFATRFPELPIYPVSEDESKVSLGYVLDKICGLKGYREGAVGLYEAQALVLVNYGGATTTDITAFAERVASIVKEKTGLIIEPEVRTLA